MKLLESSIMGGLFGAGAAVPWEGKDYSEAIENIGKAIATDSSGTYTFVEGGKNLSIMGGGGFNTTDQVSRIRSYRQMQYYPEVDEAIDNIVGDMITNDPKRIPIELDLDLLDQRDSNLPENIRNKLKEAHEKILRLAGILENPSEMARSFYVDGKQAFQIILGNEGIEKLVKLDSSSIYKVKMVKVELSKEGVEYVKEERDAFLYDSKAYMSAGARTHVLEINQNKILELPRRMIAYADSGLYTPDGKGVVGFLEAAVKPANNLSTTEDATVIYSITRAIDRRAIYVDVGDLPTKSAESVLKATMEKFKTKLNYNQSTGAINNNKAQMSMVEDMYLARRDGKNVADIQTLEAGRNLGEINHVQYFKEKLYTAMKVPRSRANENSNSMVNIGGSNLGEMDRAEYKFGRHIDSIRKKWANGVLKHSLEVEVVETNLMSQEEWDKISPFINYEFVVDNFIIEQQENETIAQRQQLLGEVEPYVGKLYSIEFVEKNILRRSEEEIKQMQEQIEREREAGLYDDYGETPLQMMSREDRAEFEPDKGEETNFGSSVAEEE